MVRIHLSHGFGNILRTHLHSCITACALIHFSPSATQAPKTVDPEQDKSLGDQDSEQPSESDISFMPAMQSSGLEVQVSMELTPHRHSNTVHPLLL